ncbi:hypothetical protein GCM10010121_072270 [Streptomyces brasiliensis]|uniref:beta-galactosidase n=1 Tax=Streptomyces brasiliensis TaxID=1954 RepID=A0A917L7X7_9ACTN|nr:hypothetical protein GCM10010121_072270 [Streptomyces brasiliensis]
MHPHATNAGHDLLSLLPGDRPDRTPDVVGHWAAIESTPALQDGFIREFWDHGIVQRVSDGRPAGRAGTGLFADGVLLPGGASEAALHERLESTAPVGIACHRHEGIVLANRQRSRGLDGLAARWELVLADGRTLTAPAALPDLRPGQTAVVPLPFALPRDGGDAWLTLRVTTARDEPWAPRGTQMCAPRVRLRIGAPAVEVDADGLLVHPALTAAPTLSLHGTSGVPDALVRKVVSVEWDGERVSVLAEYAGAVGVVRHRQEFTPVPDGIRVAESAELPEEFRDVTRVGSVLETVAGLAVEPGESCLVSVTHHRAEQPPTAAAHHDTLVPRTGYVVHLDAAHHGARTSPTRLDPPGAHRWTWTLRDL